jgi:sugar lactone lactonase YvrE
MPLCRVQRWLAAVAALGLAASLAHAQASLERVFADDTYQLTGVAVSGGGRIFTNYPLWSATHRDSVVEVLPGNRVQPYPDVAMNRWQQGEDGQDKWVCVQSVFVDGDDKLWVVDAGAPFMGKVWRNSSKLVKIDLATDRIERVYRFDGVTDDGAYLNDVRIDTQRHYAYLMNSAEGGLIVVNLDTGQARQWLARNRLLTSDPDFVFTVAGHELRNGDTQVRINSDGIALTPDGQWLYFKSLTDDRLFRILTADLRDDKLDDEALATRVQRLGRFTTTDGMIFDAAGNLYLGDIQHDAIVRIAPDLALRRLLTDARLQWPDSYPISRDGWLYLSTSQIQHSERFNRGRSTRTEPYAIWRMRLDR